MYRSAELAEMRAWLNSIVNTEGSHCCTCNKAVVMSTARCTETVCGVELTTLVAFVKQASRHRVILEINSACIKPTCVRYFSKTHTKQLPVRCLTIAMSSMNILAVLLWYSFRQASNETLSPQASASRYCILWMLMQFFEAVVDWQSEMSVLQSKGKGYH